MKKVNFCLSFEKANNENVLGDKCLELIRNLHIGAKISFDSTDFGEQIFRTKVQIDNIECIHNSWVNCLCENDFSIQAGRKMAVYTITDIFARPGNGCFVDIDLELDEGDCEKKIDVCAMDRVQFKDVETVNNAKLNVDKYLLTLREEVYNMIKQGDSAWYPSNGREPAYYALMVSIYLNLASLKQVMFVDCVTMKHLQYLNDYQRALIDGIFVNSDCGLVHIQEMFGVVHDSKQKYEAAETMGLFMRLKNQEILKHLQKRIPQLLPECGSYIFLCPSSIQVFYDNMWSWAEQQSADRMAVINRIAGVTNARQLLFKLVFLHEAGHMAFSNISTREKRESDETLANWIASMSVTKFEKECIELITKKQSDAYKKFITLPEYSIHTTKIGLVRSYEFYEKEIVKLLKDWLG